MRLSWPPPAEKLSKMVHELDQQYGCSDNKMARRRQNNGHNPKTRKGTPTAAMLHYSRHVAQSQDLTLPEGSQTDYSVPFSINMPSSPRSILPR